MATKRLPPLIGGIQQATVVDDDIDDADESDDDDDDDDPAPLVLRVSWDGRIDQA